jgi:hypothetical protein
MSEAQPQPVQDDFTAVWTTVLAGVVWMPVQAQEDIADSEQSQ